MPDNEIVLLASIISCYNNGEYATSADVYYEIIWQMVETLGNYVNANYSNGKFTLFYK